MFVQLTREAFVVMKWKGPDTDDTWINDFFPLYSKNVFEGQEIIFKQMSLAKTSACQQSLKNILTKTEYIFPFSFANAEYVNKYVVAFHYDMECKISIWDTLEDAIILYDKRTMHAVILYYNG
jgi:hypothetical protein